MDIELLNVKVTFQEPTVIVDAIGNTQNTWGDCYTCHATISGESGKEQFVAEGITDHSSVAFTVRYCRYVRGVTSTTHRIVFAGEAYEIIGIDHMSNKRKAVKFLCRKERQHE